MAATLPNHSARSPWPGPSAPPLAQLAHERLLREETHTGEGLRVDVARALELLTSGQLVNCAFDTERPDAYQPRPALAFAEPSGAPPVGAEHLTRERDFQAAQVLSADAAAARLFLRLPLMPPGVAALQRAYVEFTETTGTYHLSGGVVRVGERDAYVGMAVWQAHLIQRRRFVRVPVAIVPARLEVQADDWTWHKVAGRIFDLSLGGLGLAVAAPLAAGASVRLQIELPEQLGPLACSGRVVAPPGPAEAHLTPPMGATGTVWYRRGIAFQPLLVEDLKRVQSALYQRQVSLRRCYTATARSEGAASPAAGTQQPRALWHFWSR